MKILPLLVLGLVQAVVYAQMARGQATGTTTSRAIIQVFAGFNQPGQGTPCAAPCFGAPAGAVVIQPEGFVVASSSGLYYAVFQTNGWTGDLTTTFTLSEAGVVVQTATATGSVSTANAYSAIVLSVPTIMPQNSFVGPATLTATTTALPSGGGSPQGSKTYATLQVGGAGARRLVQAFVGISSIGPAQAFPCAAPECPFSIPAGSVMVQPAAFQNAPGNGNIYYIVVQANDWLGEVAGTAQVIEDGHVRGRASVGGLVSFPYSVIVGAGSGPALNGYPGPAILRVTTTATERGGTNRFTLTTYAPLEVE